MVSEFAQKGAKIALQKKKIILGFLALERELAWAVDIIDMQHIIRDTGHMTHDTKQVTHDK